jgi:hypothetical protein
MAVRRVAVVAGSALLVGNLGAQAARGIWNVAGGGTPDFIAFAGAARLLAHGSRCLYCLAPLAQAEALYVGHPAPAGLVGQFVNPPPAALILIPLVSLPEVVGYSLFIAASLLALAGAWWLLVHRLDSPPVATTLAVAALPGSFALAVGQWTPLLTLALTGALVLMRRRPISAGVLLSLLLLKPQTVWLVPVALLAMRRWRVILGLCLGAIAGAVLSVVLVGFGGTLLWFAAVASAGPIWLSGSSSLPGWVGSFGGVDAGYAAALSGAALTAACAARLRHRLRASPELGVAVLCSLSLLFSPHVGGADLSLLAPSLALAARRHRLLASAAAAVLTAAFLPDLSYVAVDVLPALLGVAGAAAVPVACLLTPEMSSPRTETSAPRTHRPAITPG